MLHSGACLVTQAVPFSLYSESGGDIVACDCCGIAVHEGGPGVISG